MNNNKASFSTFIKQMKCISKFKKKYLYLVLALNMIFAAIVPFIATLIPKVAIGLIQENASNSEVIKNICYLCGLMMISTLIVVYCNSIDSSHFLALRINEFSKVTKKQQEIAYHYLEEPNYMDYLYESTEALDADMLGFEGTYHNFFAFIPLAFATLIYSIVLFIFNYWIALCVLFSSAIIIVTNYYASKYAASKKKDESKAYRKMKYFSSISYDFSYGKDIRVYSLQDKLKKDMKTYSINYVNVIKNIRNNQFLLSLIEILFLLLQDSVSYFFIIKFYLDGRISASDVAFYIGIVIALSAAIRGASKQFASMVINMRLSASYFDYIENKELLECTNGQSALAKDEALEIEFKNVSFKYPNTEKWVIKNLNLKISKGEKLAIVGTNGAGKSTICKLIVGLFEPTDGEILINGIDNKLFSKKALESMFSIVFQDVNIYACSILENVTGKITDYDRDKAIECLERVGLKEKIESLPLKYDTQMLKILDNDGVELSGGQNQKIAIARALYKDGNMVILDEPTSALDALAEASIYQSFDDLVKNKTAIYISHRLSSTKFCDKIALFSQDGLIEYGNHEDLMKLKGVYYNMFITQGKYYQEGGDLNE